LFKKSEPIWFRFYLIISAVVLATLMIITVYFSNFMIRETITSAKKNLEDLLYSAEINTENYLKAYSWALSNQVIIRSLYEVGLEKNDYTLINTYKMKLESLLMEVYFSTQGLDEIIYYDNDNYSVNVGVINVSGEEQKLEDMFEKAQADNLWLSIDIKGNHYIAYFATIKYVDSEYKIYNAGRIILIINKPNMIKKCYKMESAEGNIFMALDKNNTVTVDTADKFSGKQIDDVFNKKEDIYVDKSTGEKYFMMDYKTNIQGWEEIGLRSYRTIWSPLYKRIILMVIIVFLCLLFSLVLLLFISKRLSVPLNQLAYHLEKVGEGDYSIAKTIDNSVEIKKLYNIFNDMVVKLNKQINYNLVLKIKMDEAQIKAYESQMNPHFLFNTLQLIQMLNVTGEKDHVTDATTYMSEVLRFNLESETIVQIEKEVNNIEYYFKILKLRFGDNFEYNISVPENIKKHNMIKFVLQPIVENAVFHGLNKVSRKGRIEVFAKFINSEIVFIIKDNGIGISEEDLCRLRKIINDKRVEDGIGLKNVNQRLKLYYGEKYGIEIYSKYQKETSILIYIPIIGEKRGEENV